MWLEVEWLSSSNTMIVKIASCLLFLAVLVKSDEKTDQQIIDEILNDVSEEISNKNQIAKVLNATLDKDDRVKDDYHERVYVDLLMGDGSKKQKSYEIQRFDKELYNVSNPENINLFMDLQKAAKNVSLQLEELADEMGDFSESIIVKPLGIKDQVVIKEDIRRYGNYTRLKRFGLDLKHCQLALMTLAKFHAMTAVLNEQGKLYFRNEGGVFESNVKENKTQRELARAAKSLTDSMQIARGDRWNDAEGRVDKTIEKGNKLLMEMIKASKDFPVRVLNFGSFPKTFFKYGVSDVYTSNDPIAFKLDNDYLASTVAYPLIDVNVFLATVPNVTVMLNYEDHLVKVYYDALTRYLQQYHFKKDIPTFDVFIKEWKKTEWFRLITGLTVLPKPYPSNKDNTDIEKFRSEAGKMNKEISLMDERLYGKKFIETMKQLLHKAKEHNVI